MPPTKMLPFYCTKLSGKPLQTSVWSSFGLEDTFDTSEVTELFAVDAAPTPEKAEKAEKGAKKQLVSLLDPKRSQNVGIMLSQFGKLTFAEVRNRVADLDEELLTSEKLTMMINFAPQPDEVKLIEAYDGDKALLGNPEKFFVEILQIPKLVPRLSSLLFKVEFDAKADSVASDLQTLSMACQAAVKSKGLLECLRAVRAVGNYVNHGSARGAVEGYKLESLVKLGDSKYTDPHSTCFVVPSPGTGQTRTFVQVAEGEVEDAAALRCAARQGRVVP